MGQQRECFPRNTSAGAAGLQTGLHVPARLGGDDATLLQAVLLGPDHLQVERTGVAVFVEDADVADQVDVPAAVRLHLGLARPLLASLAVANMDMLDARDHGGNGLDRVLPGAVDM